MAAAHESQSAAWTSTSVLGMAQFQHEDCTFDVWQLNLIHDGDTQQTLNLVKGHIVWKNCTWNPIYDFKKCKSFYTDPPLGLVFGTIARV